MNIPKLHEAITWSRRKLEPFRKHRERAIKQYVGFHYSEDGSADKVPLNLIELAINIYTTHLASRLPKVLITAKRRGLEYSAATFEAAVNQLIKEIRLDDTLRACVVDALFSIGLCKTGIHSGHQIEIGGFLHDVGQPFADHVSLDDWVHDMTARSYEEIGFAGNMYRLPLWYIKESGLFDPAVKDGLQLAEDTTHNEQGDERVENISQGSETRESYIQYVNLWDIWLPDENLIVTLPADRSGISSTLECRPMRVVEYDGPESGPFSRLSFNEVPDSVMPLAPVSLWRDMHELGNSLFNKIGRQAEREKTLLGVRVGGEADAERIRNASDGDIIPMDDPGSAKELRYGGPDPQLNGFMVQIRSLFSYFAGNIDSLGGLAVGADTATQDQMLQASANQRLAHMQDRTISFIQNVCEKLAWYEWTDPVRERMLTRRAEAAGIDVPITWTPETREGDFIEHDLSIEPYSTQHISPAMRLQSLSGVFNSFIAPYLELMLQSGVSIDFQELMKLVSKYANMPELEKVLDFATPTEEEPGEKNPTQPRQSPVTMRRSERISRPGATRSGQDAVLANNLMAGKNVQQAESDAVGRVA